VVTPARVSAVVAEPMEPDPGDRRMPCPVSADSVIISLTLAKGAIGRRLMRKLSLRKPVHGLSQQERGHDENSETNGACSGDAQVRDASSLSKSRRRFCTSASVLLDPLNEQLNVVALGEELGQICARLRSKGDAKKRLEDKKRLAAKKTQGFVRFQQEDAAVSSPSASTRDATASII